MLKKRNWLIVHPDSPLSTQGAILGISGKNLQILSFRGNSLS